MNILGEIVTSFSDEVITGLQFEDLVPEATLSPLEMDGGILARVDFDRVRNVFFLYLISGRRLAYVPQITTQACDTRISFLSVSASFSLSVSSPRVSALAGGDFHPLSFPCEVAIAYPLLIWRHSQKNL